MTRCVCLKYLHTHPAKVGMKPRGMRYGKLRPRFGPLVLGSGMEVS